MSIQNFGEALPAITRSQVTKKVTVAKVAKPLQFESRKWRDNQLIFIMKKGDKLYRELATGFKTWQDARLFILEQHADLVQAWAEAKALSNVMEDDLRGTGEVVTHKPERDITPEMIMSGCMPLGVTFGKWITQSERQELLNLLWVSLWDLEAVTGLAPWEWVGDLNLVFGAKGSGLRASAHYSPPENLVNFTRIQGRGAAAHEFFHKWDSGISSKIPYPKGLLGRSRKADLSKNKKYFLLERELGARVFEQYVKHKLGLLGIQNDYLVSVIPPELFGKSLECYPYMLEDETAEVFAYFDNLFDLGTYATKEEAYEVYKQAAFERYQAVISGETK